MGSPSTDTQVAARPALNPRTPASEGGQSGRLSLCRPGEPADVFSWGSGQLLRWQMPEFLGGGRDYLFAYKDGWVVYYRDEIVRQATARQLPPWLLAGVVWSEVGGDPGWIDDVAYQTRSFDHLADPLLEPLTITRKPELTSMGDVSIQLRRAAQAMGLEWKDLTSKERGQLVTCLEDEPSNLAIVAMHLRQLADVDFHGQVITTDDEVLIIGARYNRGPQWMLTQIKQDLSYGKAMLRRKERLIKLLTPPPASPEKAR